MKALRVFSNGDIIDSIIITMIFPFVSKVSCIQRGLKPSYSRFFAWLNHSSKYKLFYWEYLATYDIIIFWCWSIFCISTQVQFNWISKLHWASLNNVLCWKINSNMLHVENITLRFFIQMYIFHAMCAWLSYKFENQICFW